MLTVGQKVVCIRSPWSEPQYAEIEFDYPLCHCVYTIREFWMNPDQGDMGIRLAEIPGEPAFWVEHFRPMVMPS